MEMLKVTDMAKIVTDPALQAALAGQGIAKDGVEMVQDYGPHAFSMGSSPYAKFYRDLNSDRKFTVISSLPMVDAYGQQHELNWRDNRGIIENGNNIFHAVIDRLDTRLVALSGQPGGMNKDEEIFFHPRLFIGGSEVTPLSPLPRLLETDPLNGNYHNNVLEWDYGFCLRRIRLIEGRFLGAWVFLTSPRASVRIKYNQSGNYRLRLGQFAVAPDEEYIPTGYFEDPLFGYPLTISDTATFYPDADPETSSVDGAVRHSTGSLGSGITWSSLTAAAGTDTYDSLPVLYTNFYADNVSARWRIIFRSIVLFYTASLPDDAVIGSAVLSLYGSSKTDGLSTSPSVNIYSSNPASNTTIESADYARLGTTAFSSDITYAGWNVSGYNDFNLNTSGLAAISKTGVSKFGFRNANYDAANNPPAWMSSSSSGIVAYATEQGTVYKPKLVITFSNGETKTSGDSGSGEEVIILREIAGNELGNSMEMPALSASVQTGDTSNGMDAIGIREIAGNEQGNSAELSAISACVQTGDTANGTESIGIRELAGNEHGNSVELSAVSASVQTGDAGSGSESSANQAVGSSGSSYGADAGHGTDTLKSLVRQSGIDMKLDGNPGQLGLPGKELRL